MGLLWDAFIAAADKLEEVNEDRLDAEGLLGKTLINKDFVTDGAKMASRLVERAKNGEPPGTVGLLMEVGSFLAKDRTK